MRLGIALVVATGLVMAGDAAAQRFVTGDHSEFPKVKYADSLTSLNDRCAVAKGKLSTTIRPVYVNETPVAFCCARCPGVFSKEPESYLSAFSPALVCPVTKKSARVDAKLRAYVNHEIFYFADEASRQKFRTTPIKFVGVLTDPVSRARFKPTAKSPRADWESRPYFFESAESRAKFVESPQKYGWRDGA